MSSLPTASIVIPTRDRPEYLEVALASIVPQAIKLGAEVLVVDDGTGPGTTATSRSHGVRTVPAGGRGLNAARNAGIDASRAELIVLVDDDVEAPPGWLAALLTGVSAAPGYEVFGGPIRGRLEGGGPRACGRESAPITTLDLGPSDRDVRYVWGANMAIQRSALRRVGQFDEALSGRGDEEEWQQRYAAAGGRIRYLAAASLDHRRTAEDSSVRALSRAAYSLGRTARRNDVRKGLAPHPLAELRTLAGCLWHTLRRRCAIGIVLAAHTAGRLRETLTRNPT